MTAGDFKQAPTLIGGILASGQIPSVLLSITGAPTGGTFTLSVGGVSAAPVAYNAAAATLQTALQAVAVAGSTVTVSGSAGGPYTISITGSGGANQAIALVLNSLTGGTTPGVSFTGVNTTIYTVPAASAVKIATFSITNVAATAAVIAVSALPSGATHDGTRRILSNYTLQPGDSTKITELEGAFLGAGAFLAINSTVPAGINYLVTGAVSA